MKKLLFFFGFLLPFCSNATHVTFCVDMRNTPLDAGGVHLYVEGDTNLYLMQQSTADTNIYCLTLDLPSDSCIEYDFLNGSGFYGLEFVPVESRVDDVNSDRWICTHANSPDTIYTQPLLFGGNAPDGKTLLRLKVNMAQVPVVNPAGVFVAGTFNSWNPADILMENLYHGTVYDGMCYLTVGTHEYRFYNGTMQETVPASCSVNSNREATVAIDTVAQPVCFNDCVDCSTGIDTPNPDPAWTVFPNPISDLFTIDPGKTGGSKVMLVNKLGQNVREYSLTPRGNQQLTCSGLPAGTYLLILRSADNKTVGTKKIVVR